jgi:hypothetical protein
VFAWKHSGRRSPRWHTQLVARQAAWEIRQIVGETGLIVGDLIALYTAGGVRATVILRTAPADERWETLDDWVLTQLDTDGRRYVIDYYEGRFLSALEGLEDDEWTEDAESTVR